MKRRSVFAPVAVVAFVGLVLGSIPVGLLVRSPKSAPAVASTSAVDLSPTAPPAVPAPLEASLLPLLASAPTPLITADGIGAHKSANLLRAYPQHLANRPVPRLGDKPWLVSEVWRAQHERQLRAPGRATAKVIFLGDSITEGWGVSPAYRGLFGGYSPLNLGIANDMTQNVLWRVEHGALEGTRAQAVVLMIGVNNLAGGFTPAQTADGVRAIVTAVRARAPATRLLVLGVLPARREAGHPLRQCIRETNRLLQGLAQPGWVEVRDLGSVALEPDGSIAKATMRDFVHPTPQGFERLSQATAPHLEALLNAGTQPL